MADQDDPTYRGPPDAGRTPDSAGPRDPLAELARIVSGEPEAPAEAPQAPAAPRPASRNLARDLEAELLENLQASFDAIRAPIEPEYPHDATAETPIEPPVAEATPPEWAAPPAEPTLPRFETPAVDPYAADTPPADPYAGAQGPAEDPWPAEEQETAAGDWPDNPYDPAAVPDEQPAADAPDELPPLPDPSGYAFEQDAPAEEPRYRAAPLADRWGYAPPAADDGFAGEVAPVDPYRAGTPIDRDWDDDPAAAYADAADPVDDTAGEPGGTEYAEAELPPDGYGAERPNDTHWEDQPIEPGFDYDAAPDPYREPAEPAAADASVYEEDFEFGDETETAGESDYDDTPGYADDRDDLAASYRTAARDAFDDDDYDHAPPVAPAVAPPGAAPFERGQRSTAAAGGRSDRRSRRGLMVIGAVLGVVLVGGVSAVALFGGGDDADVLPPVISASNDPFKVEPPKAETVDPATGKLSYDRVLSDDRANGEALAGRGSEPVLDVPPPPAPSEASRDISRIILPDSPADAPASEQPDAAGGSELALQPRRVRTVVVRPDGTIVANEASGTETSPPAPPPVVAEPSSPASEGPIRLTPPEPPALPDEGPVPTPIGPRVAADTSPPDEAPALPAPQPAAAPPPEPTAPSAILPTPPPPPVRPATGNTTVAIRQPEPAPPIALAPPRAAAPQSAPSAPVPLAPPAVAPAPSVASIDAGDFVVQVSSQRSEEAAISTYRSLQRRFPSLLGGYEPAIQRADLGERGVYYRVRVGPMADRDAATAFCEQYRAAGGDCIVARF